MNQEHIGKFIAKCRKEKGLTQQEFAEILGVTDKTVSRWENGHYLPDFSLFESICSILEINITELLYGEKMEKNIEKKEVDNTIMSFINISDKKIKKEKKKIISISGIIIVIIIISCGLFIHFNKKDQVQYADTTPNSPVYFPEKIALKEHDDGWVCYFKLEYLKTDLNTPYYYGYYCDNLKYPKLDGFTAYGEEEDSTGKYKYAVETDHPRIYYNDEYDKEITKIENYFLEKKYNKPITIDDLNALDIKKIDKREVLELFNKAITSEHIEKFGNYPNIRQNPYLVRTITMDNYTWQIGYILVQGHIYYLNIDLKINNEYLSDMIKKSTANEEQKSIYDNINKIENYIMKNQKFRMPDEFYDMRPYNFLTDAFIKIENIENEK